MHTSEMKAHSLMPFSMFTLLHFSRYAEISYDVGLHSYFFIIYLHDSASFSSIYNLIEKHVDHLLPRYIYLSEYQELQDVHQH